MSQVLSQQEKITTAHIIIELRLAILLMMALFCISLSHAQLSTQDTAFPAPQKYCLSCHNGIEPTRPFASDMMQEILHKGAQWGDPNGCIVCHGGTPSETNNKNRAHWGASPNSGLTTFTPVPAALPVNDNTCGLCHPDHCYNVKRSMMNTDAGKMKAITWSFGLNTENKNHRYGDHDMNDPDGPTPRLGSAAYKNYMLALANAYPGQYPNQLQQIPEVSLNTLHSNPGQAAYTYLRNCNACHLSNKGMQDRGHHRGMGCAACHNLYSNEGYYEGGDAAIDKATPGHLLVHAMQGTRKSNITVNGHQFTGIQVSTCAACHSAGRRIGHAYQGLMAMGHSDNRGPFNLQGQPQKTNAGYVFKYIREDVHHRTMRDGQTSTGLLCQDCHVTTSMHGNGNIGATSLATLEIECSDCHGTPNYFPWELPLGYGDELLENPVGNEGRGLTTLPMAVTKEFGTQHPPRDGYLLSARGNALGNVVKDKYRVVVHSATGLDLEVPLLKAKSQSGKWRNPKQAQTAMVNVSTHINRLECYACHSTWAAQYYGYKYVIDYTQSSIDWLYSAEDTDKHGTSADYRQRHVMQPGAPTYGDYSHVRWASPPLGINGEGRVSPLVGVIQTISTIIDTDGRIVSPNRVARAAAGYNAMELAPVQPHTISTEARACTDCHGNTTTMGYGVHHGLYDAAPYKARYADVINQNGEIVSRHTEVQIPALPHLHGDFAQLIDSSGRQVQTVDSHWPRSKPLTARQREVLARDGTCLACHQDLPKGALPIRMLGQIAHMTGLSFAPEEAHNELLRENDLLISWVKFLGILTPIPLLVVAFVLFKLKKKS
ncbi:MULTISPECIES: hypothetical protein [unclassified Carboxylicivirga]|uniref:hypothetical protein n=1 Tax=Carboxylicivirga TaxID=1628153 RepID=UPI003D32FFC0